MKEMILKFYTVNEKRPPVQKDGEYLIIYENRYFIAYKFIVRYGAIRFCTEDGGEFVMNIDEPWAELPEEV